MKVFWNTITKKCHLENDSFPFGIRFYDAPMGGGKTLSMVFDTTVLLKQYPDALVFSNIVLKGVKYYQFNNVAELLKLLDLNYKTNNKHLIVLIDEGLSYFAENGGIDPALMSSITQLRKNRIFVLISSQKFKRINNRIRDFSLETVHCRCIFKKYQFNTVRDDTQLIFDKQQMDFVGVKKYSYLFKRNDDLFEMYDTLQKIDITQNVSNLFVQRGSPVATLAQGNIKKIKKVKI